MARINHRLLATTLTSLVLATSCGQDTGSGGGEVKTNLGVLGNDLATKDYNAYAAKPADQHCAAAGEGKRVIVTGFGIFSGANFNPSGVVAESMMNAEFWSGEVVARKSVPTATDAVTQPADGRLEAGNNGGRLVNRTIKVEGKTYQACFILLDVKWDLAGAIIAHEMSLFRPDMVLMSGRGANYKMFNLEGGAVNNATAMSGYGGDGHALGNENAPADASNWVDAPILESKPSGNFSSADKIKLTWDNQSLASVVADVVKPLTYTVKAIVGARADNDYICNNVSYIASYAAKGGTLRLAGGKIKIKLDAPLSTKIGFLHYPVDTTNDRATVHVLVDAVASVIGAQLK